MRTLPSGVNCTPEKRLIAVHYAFYEKEKRTLPEALKQLGVGRTALYRWKKQEYDVMVSEYVQQI